MQMQCCQRYVHCELEIVTQDTQSDLFRFLTEVVVTVLLRTAGEMFHWRFHRLLDTYVKKRDIQRYNYHKIIRTHANYDAVCLFGATAVCSTLYFMRKRECQKE